MLLSALFLTDVGGVNIFRESSYCQISEGDTNVVYIQLRDTSVNTAQEGYKPVGRRYMPAVGALLKVYIDNSLDSGKVVTKNASQPYATDPSIWSFTIQATDAISGTKNVRLELNEGGKITRGLIAGGIRAQSVTSGQ